MLSCSRLPLPSAPASVISGCGTWTISSAPMAMAQVIISINSTPPIPMIASSAVAKIGANTPETDSARLSSPLARAYCDFGSIVLIAAEYAGH